jgi:tripartite-type tricarboxylate transporter receptor subunit TctC
MSNRRSRVRVLMALALSIGTSMAAPLVQASPSWPVKPVRLVVPAPGGGGTADPLARLLADGLAKAWGQPVVVDNRPGANGILGGTVAAQAAPDGYTLLLAPAAMMTTNILLVKSMPWHPQRSFEPVGLYGTVPIVLAVNNNVPAQDLAAFVRHARDNPSKLDFASTGNGTASHLAGELFMQVTGTKLVHVPYNAPGRAVTDVIGGTVQSTFQLMPGLIGQIRSGLVRPLAVLSPTRSESLPDLPTTVESGYPALLADSWFSIVAPKGTPSAIVEKINADMNALLKNPSFVRQLAALGVQPLGGTAQEFGRFLEQELGRWSRIVQAAGVKAE